MRLFTALYQKILLWAGHQHAPYYLSALSFAEASFFPIPPDVMLIPMTLAKPQRAWFLAFLTTVTSTLGGLFGYLLGAVFFAVLYPYIQAWGYEHQYQQVQIWFNAWGFVALFIAGFSPIPYKLFTIGAGALRMNLFPFVLASLAGRGLRFFLVSGLMRWGGERLEKKLHHMVEWLGWIFVLLIVVLYLIFKKH